MRALRPRAGRARDAWALVAAMTLCLCGCAYFNTFYNAKSQFRKAEDERQKAAPPPAASGVPAGASAPGSMPGAESYQRCIDKCQLLLRYYPKSKYVDDALYLIGTSRLYRGEYVQSRAAFEELADRFPKSEYVERSYYYSGLGALRQGDDAGAAEAFGKLAAEFPDSKLNVEAVFRGAEARLDSQDYEAAHSALRAFMQDHPKSPLVADAQLRLARTYFEEGSYEEARTEYMRALEMDVTPEARYEANLNSALAQRFQAEGVLANPALQRQSRMRRGAARLEADTAPQPGASDEREPGAEVPPGAELPPGEFRPEEPPPAFPGTEDGESGGLVGDGLGLEPATQAALADSLGAPTSGDEAAVDSSSVDSTLAAEADTAVVVPLTSEEETQLHDAEQELEQVAASLTSLRKPATKLGRQVDLEIEIAVTQALLGEPAEAIASLDQLARVQPRTETAAWARYEIGEIHRRLGRFEKARSAYDESLKERRGSSVSERAQRKSSAIVARNQAKQRLREAPQVVAAWNATRAAPGDSLGPQLEAEAKYEELANQQLRLAEIDLLELGQPLVALEEFREVLARFPGSMQSARAAFGIAFVYDRELHDRERAYDAYAAVARDYADSPQGREAQSILDRWEDGGAGGEVKEPSTPR